MRKLLTIALPTYNRAEQLTRQLAWLSQVTAGAGDCCEVFISDNCSTDETPRVIDEWRAKFESVPLRTQRHPRNLGAVRNIASCIESARGRFVWTISDDDTIHDEALPYVLDALRQNPELALIVLNFSSHHARTGELIFERCFPNTSDILTTDGRSLFERLLDTSEASRWGGLALTTALVYRTMIARQAMASWPEGLDNLTVQLYITAYCALHGEILVSGEPLIAASGGVHHFTKDPNLFMRFRYAEVPEAFLRIRALGYDEAVCRRRATGQAREIRWPLVKRGLRAHPLETARVLTRFAGAITYAYILASSEGLSEVLASVSAV